MSEAAAPLRALPAPGRASVRSSAVPRHSPVLPLRVGTRGSPLALTQTRAFLASLAHACPVLRDMDVFHEQVIRTTGDRVLDRPLAAIGGKALFAKEIHEALLDRRVDLAVHSLKDLETTLPPGIVLGCVTAREDPRDALILAAELGPADPADPLACLPHGALIGTSSVRRQAQLLHARPDLEVTLLRGNVQSRLDRVRHGVVAASLLAAAGLNRLGLGHEADAILPPETMLPSACQGIVGITVREDATELRALLAMMEDRPARIAAEAERALLATLDGSCSTPIGAHARLVGAGRLRLDGLVAGLDGRFLVRDAIEGAASDAVRLGRALGSRLRALCPAALLEA